ncbi:MAG: hypothetical protein ACLFTK_15675 [Anaerolineales bacterium]
MQQFPSLMGQALDGTSYHLPSDLNGPACLLLLTFSDRCQNILHPWQDAAASLMQMIPHLRCYTLAVLEQMHPAQREFVAASLQMAIQDPTLRACTLMIFSGMIPFVQQITSHPTENILALLLDSAGAVVWHTSGACDPQKMQALHDILDQMPPRD